MKNLFILFALLSSSFNLLMAQSISGAQPKKKTQGNTLSANLATIKILPDSNCTIYIDSDLKGTLTTGQILKVKLEKGDYIIKAVGTNKLDELSQTYTVAAVGVETILNIGMAAVIKTRLQKELEIKQNEQAEKEKELADQKAQNEKDLADQKAIEEAQKKEQAKLDIMNNIEMVLVQGGTFDMGSNSKLDLSAKPVHKVTLSSFNIGKFEVTQLQWVTVMGSNPSKFENCDNCPVENVSWDDIQVFIKRLNQKTGKTYRLPTEAEWEFAASGGIKSMSKVYSGAGDELDNVGWYYDNSSHKTNPVGQKKANEIGIYDMSGNVDEWCQDWYDEHYYANSPTENPTGPATGTVRVRRGGCWNDAAHYCRIANRYFSAPELRFLTFGFRLASNP
jgi:formylglycine-generating enzyme required for sulfatase activity